MSTLVVLSPSVTQPYKPGEWLQITSDQTVSVISDPKEQNLPQLLQEVPSLLKQIASTSESTISIQERLYLHDRLTHLDSQVIEYNKEIENDFWITLLHVLLLILTFGGFSYRGTWILEEPKISLASLLPESFDPKTLDRLNDKLFLLSDPSEVVGLPLSSLIQLHYRQEISSPIKEAAKQEFSRFTAAELTEALNLGKLSEHDIVELRSALLMEAFSLMDEKQWRGLSGPIFLLAIRAVIKSEKGIQITSKTVQELFLSHGLLTVKGIEPLLTEMSTTTLSIEPWSKIAEALTPEHLVWFFLEKRLPDQTELERKKIEILLIEISKRELPQDHEILFALFPGINSYLEGATANKKALTEFYQRVWDEHTALIAQSPSLSWFEQSVATFAESGQKERFTQLLTANEEIFIQRASESTYNTNTQILTKLIDAPLTIIPGSPQGKLISAIGKRFPTLVEFWRKGSASIQNYK